VQFEEFRAKVEDLKKAIEEIGAHIPVEIREYLDSLIVRHKIACMGSEARIIPKEKKLGARPTTF